MAQELTAPGGLWMCFLICPLMPDTVRIDAPSNLATSRGDVNMSLINAVFLNTYFYEIFLVCTTPSDLEWVADELELLHNVRRLVQLSDDSCCNDAKVLVDTRHGLNSHAAGARRCDGAWGAVSELVG